MELYREPFPRIAGGVGALALGTFDGVHIGHAAVISRAIAEAAENGAPACVWCFASPPRAVRPLMSPEEKASVIGTLGVGVLIMPPPTEALLKEAPEEFLENLLSATSPRHIVVGYNYTYGSRAAGNVETLRAYLTPRGVPLTVIPPVTLNGEPVSSSTLRRLIERGSPVTDFLYREPR